MLLDTEQAATSCRLARATLAKLRVNGGDPPSARPDGEVVQAAAGVPATHSTERTLALSVA